MTENTTAAPPLSTHVPAPVPGRRVSESLSLFVDPDTRAYTLGRAVLLARENGWPTLRESEILRAILDDAINGHRAVEPAEYARIMTAGRAEMERRIAAREK
ncbi:MAG: hypothetical protein ABWY81_06135 [Jiangellaceae bacterium]